MQTTRLQPVRRLCRECYTFTSSMAHGTLNQPQETESMWELRPARRTDAGCKELMCDKALKEMCFAIQCYSPLFAVGCCTAPWYGLRQPCRLKDANWDRCTGTVAAIFPCTACTSVSIILQYTSAVACSDRLRQPCSLASGKQMRSRRAAGTFAAILSMCLAADCSTVWVGIMKASLSHNVSQF